MKAISILQPWASLVAHGHKKIETRSWNTKYRGELLIHASATPVKSIVKKMPLSFWEEVMFCALEMPLPTGCILGTVNLMDSRPVEDLLSGGVGCINGKSWKLFEPGSKEYDFGDYTAGRYGWLLDNPVLFDVPIPCKGKLGIWNFDVLENYRRLSPITDHKQLTQMFKPLELE